MRNDNKRPPPRLRCFVAMAFGHPDTDRLYAASIAPALRSLNIWPVRIDRIEHNDDIDDRIVEEIERAHFLLADLTYARPSVYFEAGYGQRSAPVIYTARADHFSARDGDPSGNLKVHFDLQMKNIIPWSEGRPAMFEQRLQSRIKKILLPLVRKMKDDDDGKARIAEFLNRSIIEKKQAVRDVCRAYLEEQSFEITDFADPRNRVQPPKDLFPGAADDFPDALLARKRGRNGLYRVVFVDVVPRLNRNLLRLYRARVVRLPLYSISFAPSERVPKQMREDYIICSLSRGTLKSFGEELPYSKVGALNGTVTWESTLPVTSGTKRQTIKTPRLVTFHLLDQPATLANLREELRRRC